MQNRLGKEIILFFLLFFLLFSPFNNGFYSNSYIIPLLLFSFLFFSLDILFTQKKAYLNLNRFLWLFISVTLISYIIATVLSSNLSKSIYSLFYLLTLFLVFLMALNIKAENHKYFYLVGLAVSLIITGIGFKNFIESPLMWERMSGTFVNSNNFGTYIAFSLIFPISYLLNKENSTARRCILWIATAGLLTALILSRSRGGFLSLTAGLFTLFLFKNKKITLQVTALLFAGFIFYQFLSYINKPQDFKLFLFDPARVAIWKTTISMILDKPLFGIGPGLFEDIVGRYDFNVPSGISSFKYNIKPNFAHSEYLQIWVEGGTIFFASSMILLASYLIYPFKKLYTLKNDTYFPAFFSATIVILTHSLIDFPLHFFGLSIPFVIFSAFSIRIMLNYDENKKIKPFFSKILYCLISIFALIAIPIFLSDYFYTRGANAYPLEKGVPHLDRSLKLNPFKSEAYAKKAEYYFRIAREKNSSPDMSLIENEMLKAMKWNPDTWIYPYTLGQYYLIAGSNHKSSESFEKAIFYQKTAAEKEPYNPHLYFIIGRIYYKAGRFDDSLPFLKKTSTIEPMFAQAYFYQGLIYKKQKEYDKAAEMLKTAVLKHKEFQILYTMKNKPEYEASVAALDLKETYKELALIYLLKNDEKTARYYLDLYSREKK